MLVKTIKSPYLLTISYSRGLLNKSGYFCSLKKMVDYGNENIF
jgi:hypothetical protein